VRLLEEQLEPAQLVEQPLVEPGRLVAPALWERRPERVFKVKRHYQSDGLKVRVKPRGLESPLMAGRCDMAKLASPCMHDLLGACKSPR
jgi:hypothetical protein